MSARYGYALIRIDTNRVACADTREWVLFEIRDHRNPVDDATESCEAVNLNIDERDWRCALELLQGQASAAFRMNPWSNG